MIKTDYLKNYNNKISTGSTVFDKLLDGGFEKGIITTIYGASATGKTTIAMLTSIENAKKNLKTFFIDTEKGFSIERFKQLTNSDNYLLSKILLLNPHNFFEQMKNIEKIKKIINDKIKLVIIDTISMFYRFEISSNNEIKKINNLLGIQIAWLSEIAKEQNIPIIITNQVYSDFKIKDNVKMVGGDLLKYASKCLIELKEVNEYKKATIKKHRSLPENKEIKFKIENFGFTQIKD
ncbi:MAG: DNA repair and recombination protein RadB [Candidatus Woesearchaeota archaeon]